MMVEGAERWEGEVGRHEEGGQEMERKRERERRGGKSRPHTPQSFLKVDTYALCALLARCTQHIWLVESPARAVSKSSLFVIISDLE